MKRYCFEEFRDLNKNLFVEESKYPINLLKPIKDFIQECFEKNSENQIGIDSTEWSKYGISEDEKTDLVVRRTKPEERYIIDFPLEKMTKLTSAEQFKFDFLNSGTKSLFLGAIYSKVVMHDIVNEMYLVLCKINSAEICFSKGMTRDEKHNATNYFRNSKKSETSNQVPFGGMPNGLNEEVDSFGSDIMRLWACSREFRGLFRKIQNITEKYELEKFASCLDMKKKMIQGKEENNLILDKMMSLSVISAFYRYIYPRVKDFEKRDYGDIVRFIEIVMDCNVNYMRCELVKQAGLELNSIRNADKIYRRKRMRLYCIYLEEIIPKLNEQYKEMGKIFLKEIKTDFSFDDCVCWIDDIKKGYDCNSEYRIDYAELNNYFEDIGNNEIMRTVIKKVLDKNVQRYMNF